MEKKVIILAGPSAAGKTTVMNRIVELHPEFELVRSATTRAPRGDGNDDEYIYLSEEEFREKIANRGVLEYTEYGGALYGTPASEIERIFASGKIPFLILDINGVASVRERAEGYGVVSAYIFSDIKALEKRLAERYLTNPTDSTRASYDRRIKENERDFSRACEWACHFDAFVENLTVESAADDVLALFFEGKKLDVCPERLISMLKE